MAVLPVCLTIMSAAAAVAGSSDLRLHCRDSLRICRRRACGCPKLQKVKQCRYLRHDLATPYCHLTLQLQKYPLQSYSERYFRRIPRGRPSILPGSSFDLLELLRQTLCRSVHYENPWYLSCRYYGGLQLRLRQAQHWRLLTTA